MLGNNSRLHKFGITVGKVIAQEQFMPVVSVITPKWQKNPSDCLPIIYLNTGSQNE